MRLNNRQIKHRLKKDAVMPQLQLIKNIPFSEAHNLKELVDYKDGRIVSRTLAQNDALSLTLFAFEVNEEISTHSAPGDAMVQILDGEASITIDGQKVSAKAGEVVVMPADIPHGLSAKKRFKMLLTLVNKPQAQ